MGFDRLSRPSRAAALAAALALFLLGSNYCLLSAWTGAPMSCMARTGSVPASHCCHGQPAKSGRAAAPTLSPCCVSLAPVAPLVLDEGAATSAAVCVLPAAGLAPSMDEPARQVPRAFDEQPPPPGAPRAVSAPRAPPLA